nr:MAG TPA: hypothetical protein [Caudoviricetes sp.]
MSSLRNSFYFMKKKNENQIQKNHGQCNLSKKAERLRRLFRSLLC